MGRPSTSSGFLPPPPFPPIPPSLEPGRWAAATQRGHQRRHTGVAQCAAAAVASAPPATSASLTRAARVCRIGPAPVGEWGLGALPRAGSVASRHRLWFRRIADCDCFVARAIRFVTPIGLQAISVFRIAQVAKFASHCHVSRPPSRQCGSRDARGMVTGPLPDGGQCFRAEKRTPCLACLLI